jgi:hypothetical protein
MPGEVMGTLHIKTFLASAVGFAGRGLAHSCVLTPGRYVGMEEADSDGEPVIERLARLQTVLWASLNNLANWNQTLRQRLKDVPCQLTGSRPP